MTGGAGHSPYSKGFTVGETDINPGFRWVTKTGPLVDPSGETGTGEAQCADSQGSSLRKNPRSNLVEGEGTEDEPQDPFDIFVPILSPKFYVRGGT